MGISVEPAKESGVAQNRLSLVGEQIRSRGRWLLLALGILLGLAVYLNRIGTTVGLLQWSGFEGKTLWDLMELVIIPAAFGAVAYLFNRAERKAELEIAQQRDQTDLQIASDRIHEAALQAYLDRMTDLLLEKGLRESEADAEIREVARVRTVTVLQGLDGTRKGQVLRFLAASRLIGTYEQIPIIIVLEGADLRSADLTWANLAGSYLNSVVLNGAELNWANLVGANLNEASLSGADLSNAFMSTARLLAAFLEGAELIGTDLERANLSGALLMGAKLEWAKLLEADLSGADLSGADMSNADLSGADLELADLTGAKVTLEQLQQAKSLKGATMPDGSKHE